MSQGFTPAEGDRVRAKQAQMLAIDEAFAERWLSTMRHLISLQLEDLEFTTARMDALKLWTKQRKLAQHNLHYQFDLNRRRAGLVDKEIRLTQDPEKLLVKMEAMAAKLQALHPKLDSIETELRTGSVRPAEIPKPLEPEKSERPLAEMIPLLSETDPGMSEPFNRGLLNLDDAMMRLIRLGTGNLNIQRATDAEILAAFRRNGIPRSRAVPLLQLINNS